jgi:hypothetical protein
LAIRLPTDPRLTAKRIARPRRTNGHNLSKTLAAIRYGKANTVAKAARITRKIAESLAIQALGYMAGDPERLGAFLAATGIGPEMIRQAAADPAFLAGVLDHVCGDEALLLAVAEHAGIPPQEIEHAQAVLSGRPWQREVP